MLSPRVSNTRELINPSQRVTSNSQFKDFRSSVGATKCGLQWQNRVSCPRFLRNLSAASTESGSLRSLRCRTRLAQGGIGRCWVRSCVHEPNRIGKNCCSRLKGRLHILLAKVGGRQQLGPQRARFQNRRQCSKGNDVKGIRR